MFNDRVSSWHHLGAGLTYAAVAYNLFCVFVLSYVWQLEEPDATVRNAEAAALRKMAPGPGNLCLASDLCRLRECLGLPKSFIGIEHAALSVKIRVSFADGVNSYGRAAELRRLRLTTDFFACIHSGRLGMIPGS